LYKLIFEFLTEPLGLPIQWYWEYIILGIVGTIAFNIAWEISPGGRFGSEIHWLVRIIAFVILWAIVRGIITAVQWLISNWASALIVSIVLVVLISCIILVVKKREEKKRKTV
jgi:hypothetical protein